MISEVKETVYRVWTGLNTCKITTAQINGVTQEVNSLRDYMLECSPFWVTFFSSDQGRNQDFSKGGHTVSKWVYSPDCHVVFATCCLQKGGHGHPRTPPSYPTEILPFISVLQTTKQLSKMCSTRVTKAWHVSSRTRTCIFNKLTPVFHASVLLLITNFVITLSK